MRLRKWIQAILLLMLGLYFLDNMLSGRIAFYVSSTFYILPIIAGFIFLALGIMSVANLLSEPLPAKVGEEHDHHDHEHHHEHHDHEENDALAHARHNHGTVASWPILAIAAIPLALGILVPAKPLGATAIGTSGVTTSISAAAASKTTTLSVSPTDRNVLDWVRAFSGSSNMSEFTGQSVDLTGFVYRDIRFKDTPNKFMIARFVLSCCVADASAIGVFVDSSDASKYAQDGWLHIKGKISVQDFDGQPTAFIIPESIEQIGQPDRPYLYP